MMREMFVTADRLNWHIEETGQGPTVFLVHGTAASTHSWRDVMPLLAAKYHVLSIDLPGHGKTNSIGSADFSLPRMANGLSALLDEMKLKPDIVVGHSAGAAILAHACAHKTITPKALVSFNGAFYPFGGIAGSLFSPIAKMLAFNPFLPRILSSVATKAKVKKLLHDTGSELSADSVDRYLSLFKEPSHIKAALGMMASWDLRDMDDNLVRLKCNVVFVAGDKDKSVSPETADRAAAKCHGSKALHIAQYGHLLHEEAPELAAQIIGGTYPW
jgi:magnesium chelatase accessory protein